MAHRLILDPLPIETPKVVFDITRLYRNRQSPFGTGVDRIDLAIGRDLVARFGDMCRFVHVCYGGWAEMPWRAGCDLLDRLDARWHGGADQGGDDLSLPLIAGRIQAATGRGLASVDTTYVVASHSGLPQRAGYLDRFDPGRKAARLAYIHDLIPLEYPEYQTERSTKIFRRYLDELAAAPVRFCVNSADTGKRLASYAALRNWPIAPPLTFIPRLEGDAPSGPTRAALAPFLSGEAPFFLTVGTIEPRKNHLLLLHLWREMAAAGEAPHLIIAGRRGWMNEAILALLDRCAAIQPHVTEFPDLTDGEIAALMRSARALLFPSFVEGLGLPALEAKAAGLKMIAADLPALREIAGDETVFLDPLDGPAWRHAIAAAY